MMLEEKDRLSIETRATSSFPISLGTALALESIFIDSPEGYYDPEREIPQRVKLFEYGEIWINVYTLYRNLIGSMKAEVLPGLKPEQIAQALHQEIDVITSLFKNEGGGVCQPFFYFCDYRSLLMASRHKAIHFREDKTEKQRLFKQKGMKSIELLMKGNHDIKRLDDTLKTLIPSTKALVLTHIAYDLLSYTQFSRLDLIESNTGRVKTRREWNSKYADCGQRKMNMLPFLRKLLLVFGDPVLIKPGESKLRNLVLDIAEKRRWTPMVTESQMMQHFSIDVKEPYVLKFLRDL